MTLIELAPEPRSSIGQIWLDFDAGMRRDLARVGQRQSAEAIEEWRFVAPGIVLTPDEFEARFSHLNLDALRANLTEPVFNALVHHMGIFEVPSGLDVAALTGELSG